MERPVKSKADAIRLLQLSELLAASARTVVDEWSKETTPQTAKSLKDDGSPKTLPSPTLHEAQRTIQSITGVLTELVSEPSGRIIEVACQYWESRALFIAAERRIPDLLAKAGEDGLSSKELADATGVEYLKLCMFKFYSHYLYHPFSFTELLFSSNSKMSLFNTHFQTSRPRPVRK